MLNQALMNVKTVAISGHIKPDGDCVGSCMGLYQYIKNNFADVDVENSLEFLPNTHQHPHRQNCF